MSITELYRLFKLHPVICSDTRILREGCLFFALKGDHFNGNQFAQKALKEGAAYAIIDEKEFCKDPKCILVQNVLESLQQLAIYHREQLNIPVIAIVGSNGKTTTKELISAVLATRFNVLSTPGNFNNQIGVPLTLLLLTPQHEMAIIEIGANHIGENKFLCELSKPSHGLITNNGKDHLEGYGSMEGVIKSNGELFDYFKRVPGIAFVNANDAELIRMSNDLPHKETYAANFGSMHTSADYVAKAIRLQPQIKFELNDEPGQIIHSHLSGDYNFDNIMAAIAIGKHFGLNSEQLKKGIESYKPQNLRSQVIEKEHNRVFLDAYNANPSSMEVSIRNFAAMEGEDKVLILGDMFELGPFEAIEHQALTDYCKRLNFNSVFLVGPAFAKTDTQYSKFYQLQQLIEYLKATPIMNKFIFIKGSRSMKLESLLEWLS